VSAFKDHFSTGSAAYAAYRPTYPRALVDFLADASPSTELALDCGCGSGQLSTLLAERFSRVIATDASAQQIANAEPHANVEYRVAPAEASGLPDGSADLVTAAQAAHWFDLPAFYAEARRVARPGGIVSLVTYGVIEMDEPVHAVVRRFYRDVVGPYWPPERRHVEEGYRAFGFPFEEFPAPPLDIAVAWTLNELSGYAETWSATRAAEKALGREPVERFRQALAQAWGEPEMRHTVRFPLSLRVGRVVKG
jgi:SAM-dependent methyltransferase